MGLIATGDLAYTIVAQVATVPAFGLVEVLVFI